MPTWNPSQTSFNAGEVSPRMISRMDTEVYQQAVLFMLNWMPHLQGPAIRSPGTTFFEQLDADNARLLPYLTIDNQRSLVELTDGQARIVTDVDEPLPLATAGETTYAASSLRQQIVGNQDFDKNAGEWDFTPVFFYGGSDDPLGCKYVVQGYDGVLQISCRDYKYPNKDNIDCTVIQTINVPVASDTITFDYRMIYEANPGLAGEDYTFTIVVGSTPGGTDVLNETLEGPIGTITQRVRTVSLPSAGFTGDLYITFYLKAEEYASHPHFRLDRFAAFTNANPIVGDVVLESPYLEDELEAVQFVQSPYLNKELVMVHPNHPPHWLFFDPDAVEYVLEPIPIVDTDLPWAAGDYPGVCTAYQGRLIVASSPSFAETVWGSAPGDWKDFLHIGGDTLDDAIEFTTIYRSPVLWMYGQKDLIIGTREYEYIVTADSGLVQAGDIDVRLHSTNGGVPVQPASFGKFVAFAAERGARVRAAHVNRDDQGWIAPDLTMLADHITISGVRRMVRVRNPHQMLLCVLNNGTLALFHHDENANVSGWSRLDVGGAVQDVALVTEPNGVDVPYLLVKRTVDGVTKLLVEGIFSWVYESDWNYMSSYNQYIFDTPTSVIGALEHLEGERVQVIGDRAYLGSFTVSGGSITLEDQAGNTVEVNAAVVGLAMSSSLTLLPPVVDARTGLGSLKRYSELVVRTIGSTRPIINGERPADRDPATLMNISQGPDIIRENQVSKVGTDTFQFITIEERVPFKTEVLSITGKLAAESL